MNDLFIDLYMHDINLYNYVINWCNFAKVKTRSLNYEETLTQGIFCNYP